MTTTHLIFVGYALGLAVIPSFVLWVLEFVFGRRVGVYLSYATTLLITSLIVLQVYFQVSLCVFGNPPFPQCEWFPVIIFLLGSLMLLTIPTLVISTMMLKKFPIAEVSA
jgi:hypothetical protein